MIKPGTMMLYCYEGVKYAVEVLKVNGHRITILFGDDTKLKNMFCPTYNSEIRSYIVDASELMPFAF